MGGDLGSVGLSGHCLFDTAAGPCCPINNRFDPVIVVLRAKQRSQGRLQKRSNTVKLKLSVFEYGHLALLASTLPKKPRQLGFWFVAGHQVGRLGLSRTCS